MAGVGVNVTGASGRGKPRRHRNEGLEVEYSQLSSTSRATLAEDGPASPPAPPEVLDLGNGLTGVVRGVLQQETAAAASGSSTAGVDW